MNAPRLRLGLFCLAPLLLVGACSNPPSAAEEGEDSAAIEDLQQTRVEEGTMTIQYLEIVTPEVDTTCQLLAKAHGVVFGDPNPGFGGARSADLAGGGRIGVRGPLRDDEVPVVRPYVLVEDINAAVKVAEEAGAVIALPPMEIPGEGMFSVYILGGIEHGLWQF